MLADRFSCHGKRRSAFLRVIFYNFLLIGLKTLPFWLKGDA
jgi:hypothetical protein